MITENLSTLKIHKLTQEQYERELAAGRVDENALYLTPYEETDLSDYATKEYVNNKITENSGSSESSDIFVVTIDYEHNTASHSASEIGAAYESGKIVVTIDSEGMLVPLFWVNEDKAIFQYIYDENMLCSVDIIVGEDKQVTINNREYSIEVPHFDFASMGMSPIPMPTGTVTFVHDMTDIIESLAKGAVSVRIPCSSDGTTIFHFDCHVMGHTKVGADCVQVSVPAFLFNQAGESIRNFLVTAIIYADRAVINVEPFNASGSSGVALVVLDEEDMTSSFTASQIKEAVAKSKNVMIMANGVISDAIVTYDPTLDFVNLHVIGHRSETQLRAMSFKVNNDGTILALVDNMEIVPPLDNVADGKVLMSAGGVPIWADAPSGSSGVSNSDVLVVKIDFNTNIASHSPAEIKSACNEGKVVITADRGHLLVPLYNAGNTTAVFKAVYYTAAKTLMEEKYTISQNRSVTETSQIILDNENGTGGGGYTPVRGVDYWTDEDKAEIKSYVDEAILGGAW